MNDDDILFLIIFFILYFFCLIESGVNSGPKHDGFMKYSSIRVLLTKLCLLLTKHRAAAFAVLIQYFKHAKC